MNSFGIEEALADLGRNWPAASVTDDVMARVQAETVQRPAKSTARAWTIGLLASAAASVAIGILLITSLGAPRTLQAQVEWALARTKAAHFASWQLDEKGDRQETNIWYSRERGFRMESPEQTIVYDGKQQWEWQPGDGANETLVVLRRGSDGREIIAGTFAPLRDAPADWKRHRAADHDREIDGVRCRAYLVTPPGVQEPSENEELKAPRNPPRTIVWTDPQDRLVEAEQQRQVQGQWQSSYHASIRYDAEVPADKLIANLPAGAKVVSPEAALDERLPLAGALATKETGGLLFAIHETERMEGGMVYIVSSVRGTPAYLKAHPPARRRDCNMTASILDVAHVPDVAGNIDGNWNRASLALAEHDGVYYSWWLAVPRSSYIVKDGVEVQLDGPTDADAINIPPITLYAWPHTLRDSRGVGQYVSAAFELSPPDKATTLHQIAARVLHNANDLTAHGVFLGLRGGIGATGMRNLIPREVDTDHFVEEIRSQLAWLHTTDDVTDLQGIGAENQVTREEADKSEVQLVDLGPSAITAQELRQALLDAAARLDNLNITVVERGDAAVREPGMPIPVVFKEIWMHGQSAQAWMVWRQSDGRGRWWQGFNAHGRPLTSADLVSLADMKMCVNMQRKLVWADSRPLAPTGPTKRTTLHSISKSPKWPCPLFLPLATLDKPWQSNAGAPVVNDVARRPLSAWHVLGEERLNDIECVKAQISQQEPVAFPLKRHAGELILKPTYLAWFSKSHGLMPVRVEQTARYNVQDREYALIAPRGVASVLYQASDFRRVGAAWMPYAGRQDSYGSMPSSQSAKQFDPDEFVDRLLADGAIHWQGDVQLLTRREWRVLSMEPIDPALNLWFEPQTGAEVHNVDTDERYVQGDAVASKKYADEAQAIREMVGKPPPDFPKGATWLNGEPLTWQALRGKTVILDFWAITCGACYSDLPELARLHEARESNGLVVVGVHSPDSEAAPIRAVLEKHKLDYPICIDVPPASGSQAWGEFSSQFAIGAIPHFVAVDANGTVIASATNRFHDVLAAVRKAAETPGF